MDYVKEAYRLLKDWKGDSYIFGLSVLDKIGEVASRFGQKALLISNTTYMKPVADSLQKRCTIGGELYMSRCKTECAQRRRLQNRIVYFTHNPGLRYRVGRRVYDRCV